MRRLCIIVSFLFFNLVVTAQEFKAQQVKGLPTEEIFNIYSDSKGFLWVANSLGLSRFDGISFTNFHNAEESSLGVTDILEDKQGRIWCHNFNGQIFYVENEKMKLLHEYKYAEESFFPRLVLLGDELIASSEKGLFICNTSNMQCKYLYYNKNKKISSLARVADVIYVYDGERWICYNSGKGISEMHFRNKTNELFTNADPAIQPLITSDTIYSKDFKSKIFKFIISKDTVILAQVINEKSFVNNITTNNKTIWINTKKESYTTDGKQKIKNFNLTDIITDREGNTWYSSLEKGLWIQPKLKIWEESSLKSLSKDDFVRCSQKQKGVVLYGTQNGDLFVKSITSKKVTNHFKLPTKAGSIENIFVLSEDEFLIAPSIGTYLVNTKWNEIYQLSDQETIKSIVLADDAFYVAYSRSFSFINKPKDKNNTRLEYEKNYIKQLVENFKNKTILRDKRCYTVCIDSSKKKIFASFKDGLYEYNNKEFRSILFHDTIIASISLQYENNQLFIGTLNNGIFILDNAGIKNINTYNGLASNNILKLKRIENSLFIIEPNSLQTLDLNTNNIISTITLPLNRSGLIYDVWKEDSLLYTASNKTIYTASFHSLRTPIIPNNYLISVSLNNAVIESDPAKLLSLPYFKNDIEFKIVSPSFIYPEATYFKYRLVNDYDTAWQQTNSNQRTISFFSLQPGLYTFEAVAVNFQNNVSKPVIFSFEIMKPWWRQLWFLFIVMIIIILVVYGFINFNIKNLKKQNLGTIEKLNLQNELRKSRLSTIKAQMNPHFIFNSLNAIQGFVYSDDKKNATKYLGKFSNLVRNILDNSTKNEITLSKGIELLHLYLELEKVRFENNLNIQIEIDNDLDTEFISIPPMLIQPYVENAIVHGLFHKKENKELIVIIKKSTLEDYIEISIEDNGIGRNASEKINKQRKDHLGFSSNANAKRIELLNQVLTKKIKVEIIDKKDEHQNDAGTLVILSIPILKTID